MKNKRKRKIFSGYPNFERNKKKEITVGLDSNHKEM
jgi:hypothetical protein